jgi:hypothetical protein
MYLLHICILFNILSVFVFLYTGKRKEKLPLVFTQGKGLKIDPFEFSTRSLGPPISNPGGSIFRPFSCTLGFCSFVFGPPFLYRFHSFSSFSSLLLCEVLQHMVYRYNNQNYKVNGSHAYHIFFEASLSVRTRITWSVHSG